MSSSMPTYNNVINGLLGVISNPDLANTEGFERSKTRLLDWAFLWNGEEGRADILNLLDTLEQPVPEVSGQQYTRIRNYIVDKLKAIPPPPQKNKAKRRPKPTAEQRNARLQTPNKFFLNGHLGVINNPLYKETDIAKNSKEILLKIADRRGGGDEVDDITKQLEALKMPDQPPSVYTARRKDIVQRLEHVQH